MARKGKQDKEIQIKLPKYQYKSVHKRRSDDVDEKKAQEELGTEPATTSSDQMAICEGLENINNGTATTTTTMDNDDYGSDDYGSEMDDFESKLIQLLDSIQESKSGSKTKLMHWNSLAKAFGARYCYDYLDDRKVTLQDIFERGLKRSEEADAVVHALSLVMITMGTSTFCEDIFRELYPQLRRLFLDSTSAASLRTKCATALSLGCFITDYGLEIFQELLSEILSVAHESGSKLTQTGPSQLPVTCLDMLGFLVTTKPASVSRRFLRENRSKLTKYLESDSLSLRVASGELIALLLESGSPLEGDELPVQDRQLLCEKLRQLATDSQKFRSKKDLREQRSNFRQILRMVEHSDGSGPDFSSVKFGSEEFRIDSWQLKRDYDTFCGVLGSGINLHLAQNPLLREVFGLGPVLVDSGAPGKKAKMSKSQKNYFNNVNRKFREISRTRLRDRRHISAFDAD